MSDLDSLVAAAETRFEELRVEADAIEERARHCRIEAEKARAYADGLRAAQAAMPVARVRQKPANEQGSRNRDLTAAWKQILQAAYDDSFGLPFDYDELTAASKRVGHEASRDTLRSQMSLYKARGLVEPHGTGSFYLTPAGLEAIAMPKPEVQPTKKPAFNVSDFADDDDSPF